MNALFGCWLLTCILYGIFVDGTYWKIYGALLVAYFAFVRWQMDARENPKRKTMLISTWNQPSDPTVYVVNDYHMDNALAYCKRLNSEQKEAHITLTHVVTLATAWGLYKMRRDVGRLPWGTFRAAKKFGVTVLVDVEGGKDLTPVTIWDAHKMSIFEVAKVITEKVQRAKTGRDAVHTQQTQLANFVPSFIMQPLMASISYLGGTVGLTIKPFAVSPNSFGHVVITNVGNMGYTAAYAPLCPPLQQMAILCTGAVEKRPVVDKEDGDKIKVASMMTCVSTGDHRYGDAAIMNPFFKTMKGFMEDPAGFDETKYRDVVHYSEPKKE